MGFSWLYFDRLFQIVVLPVNDAPSFTLPGNINLDEDSTAQILMNWATDLEDGDPEVVQAMSFMLSNDNMSLFSVQPAMDSSGTVILTPASNAFGSALVSVTLSDDGGMDNGGVYSSSQDFTLTLDPVNDPPSFTVGSNVPGATL